MQVSELIDLLGDFEGETEVFLASDDEWNTIRPLNHPDNAFLVEDYNEFHEIVREDLLDYDGNVLNAIVLW